MTSYRTNQSLSCQTKKPKVRKTPYLGRCAIYSSIWKETHPHAVVSTAPTIESALRLAEQISVQKGGMQALITGSLYLVGGALGLLRP